MTDSGDGQAKPTRDGAGLPAPRRRDQAGAFLTTELSPEAVLFRQAQAYKMRLAGAPYDGIASALGVSSTTAARDVKAAHEAFRRETAEELALMRQQQLDRLNLALFAVMPLVKKGDLPAVDRMLAIEKRRSDLMGLDAPRRVELTGKDGSPIEQDINIREHWTPEEARERAIEIGRRIGVAVRETGRLLGQDVGAGRTGDGHDT